jgi:hypothetical protein
MLSRTHRIGRWPPGHPYSRRFKCMRFGRNIRVEGRIGFAGYNGALFLCGNWRFNSARHRDGFCKNQPVKALFWASTINGVLAPFLLIGVLLVSCDRKLMQRQPSSWLSRVMVGLTAALMFVAALLCLLDKALYFRPPFLPPLRELDLLRFFPRPPPPFFRPPLSDLFTVAHARRSASLVLTPRFL